MFKGKWHNLERSICRTNKLRKRSDLYIQYLRLFVLVLLGVTSARHRRNSIYYIFWMLSQPSFAQKFYKSKHICYFLPHTSLYQKASRSSKKELRLQWTASDYGCIFKIISDSLDYIYRIPKETFYDILQTAFVFVCFTIKKP